MNQPIVYAIVAMVCYGLSDFIYKQAATAGIRADHFLMAQGWFFCPSSSSIHSQPTRWLSIWLHCGARLPALSSLLVFIISFTAWQSVRSALTHRSSAGILSSPL